MLSGSGMPHALQMADFECRFWATEDVQCVDGMPTIAMDASQLHLWSRCTSGRACDASLVLGRTVVAENVANSAVAAGQLRVSDTTPNEMATTKAPNDGGSPLALVSVSMSVLHSLAFKSQDRVVKLHAVSEHHRVPVSSRISVRIFSPTGAHADDADGLPGRRLVDEAVIDIEALGTRRDLRALGVSVHANAMAPRQREHADGEAVADFLVIRHLLPTLLHNRVLTNGQVVGLPLFGAGSRGMQYLQVYNAEPPVRAKDNADDSCDGAGVGDGPSDAAIDGDAALVRRMRLFRIDANSTSVVAANAASVPSGVPSPSQWLAAAADMHPGRFSLLRSAIAALWHPGGNSIGNLASTSLLIAGAPGCGKSQFAQSIATAAQRPCYRITSTGLYRSVPGASEAGIERLLAIAMETAPSFVIIEDCDIILSANPASWLAQRCASAILRAMDTTANSKAGVAWIGVTSDPGTVISRAFGPSRFAHVLHIGMPTPHDRFVMLTHLTRQLREAHGTAEVASHWPALLRTAAQRTHGYTAADLSYLVTTAAGIMAKQDVAWAKSAGLQSQLPADEGETFRRWHDAFTSALSTSKPSLLLQAIGSPPLPLELKDVIGMEATVNAAVHAVLTPLVHAGLYLRMGVTPPRGLLIHGPGGSGKTMLAHAIANTARSQGIANALVVQGPDIISALVGSSESALASIFERARELSPCVLVLDQFELMAPARTLVDDTAGDDEGASQSGSLSGAGDRLLSVLLTEMDGLTGGSNGASSGSLGDVLAGCLTAVDAAQHPVGRGTLDPDRPLSALAALEAACFGADNSNDVGDGTVASMPHSHSASASPQVVIIAVTHDRRLLDPAVLRPGRLDTHVQTDTPSRSDRNVLLQTLFARSPLAIPGSTSSGATSPASTVTEAASADRSATVVRFAPDGLETQIGAHVSAADVPAGSPWDAVLDRLVEASESWSRASVVGLWQAAAMFAVRRSLSAAHHGATATAASSHDALQPSITEADIDEALAESRAQR